MINMTASKPMSLGSLLFSSIFLGFSIFLVTAVFSGGYLPQPRSQGLSSLPPLSLRKDPGSLWSRVCQNLEGSPNVCWGMGGNVGLVDIAKKGISTQLILWPDDHRQNV